MVINAENADVKTCGGGTKYWNLWSNGHIAHTVNFPEAGKYMFTLSMRSRLILNEWAYAELRLDSETVKTISVDTDLFQPE